MSEKNRNLLIRILTSMVALPLIIYCTYLGSWPFSALMGFAAAICALEYYEITMGGWSPAAWVGVVVTASLPFTPLFSQGGGQAAFFIVVGYGMFAWAYHLVRGPLKEGPLYVAYLTTGMVYGASGLTAMAALRQIKDGGFWVIAAVVISFANDTFAYFAGRAFGKHKMYPAVSPNKSWEGFAGGVVGNVVMMFVYKQFFFPGLTVVDLLILAIAGSIFGPVGDFCESMLKRSHGVKDSGKIIPGHGGILDRIDALIFNAPMTFAYVYFVRSFVVG